MKFSLSSSFTRLTLNLVASIILLSIAGVVASETGVTAACGGWPFCIPRDRFGWFELFHVILGIVAGILVLRLLFRAWNDLFRHPILLPLATVTTVLFFGQALVGALEVLRGYPLHLVVLHATTSASLWISLVGLLACSIFLPNTEGEPRNREDRRHLGDFLALNKPWIVLLLLVTTFGGLVAGARGWPSPALVAWTLLGGALAAGGASALNQYIDRDLDKNMQRTAQRPLPAGRLTPAEALSYGLGLCLVSYYVFASMVNIAAALLSLAGILYYVVLYSILLKRATVQNIVIGGGAGAIPPLVGWAAATGHLSLGAWILFLIIFVWTPPHFWSLAIVRIKDYEKAGIPMLPVIRGEQAARAQILFYTVLLVFTSLLLPLTGDAGITYAVSASVLGLVLLGAAWRVWRIPGNKVAWTMYRASSMYLMLLFAALVVDALV